MSGAHRDTVSVLGAAPRRRVVAPLLLDARGARRGRGGARRAGGAGRVVPGSTARLAQPILAFPSQLGVGQRLELEVTARTRVVASPDVLDESEI